MSRRLARAKRHLGRWLSLAGFIVAGLCFLLPFSVVSCDAPGGYGRVAQGGTTTYTGADLVVGGQPSVETKHLRPPEQRRDDRLPVQPLAAATLTLIVAGAVAVGSLRDMGVRRIAAATAGALAAVFLAANTLAVQAQLEARLREQLTVPMPVGKSASDFVNVGNGAALCLLFVGLTAAGNAIALLIGRRRRARAANATSPIPI